MPTLASLKVRLRQAHDADRDRRALAAVRRQIEAGGGESGNGTDTR